MKDSKAVRLIALAYDEGRATGFSEGYAYAQGEYEDDLAEAKSQAYEAGYAKAQEEAHNSGYAQGFSDGKARAENSYNSGLEAGVKAERERAEAAEPKLSVWFRPCGPMPVSNEGEVLGCPPGLDKLKAIKAIRQAYTYAEGYGLKEVKDMVETVSFGARFAAGQPLPQSKAVELYLQLQVAGFDPVLRAQD